MSLDFFTKDTPLILLGCGNMGRAMMLGWLKGGLSADALQVIDPGYTHSKADGVLNHHTSAEALTLRGHAGAIVLAVKPQVMAEIASGARHLVSAETLVLSVAAGITTESLKAMLPSAGAVVRAMPNTPAAIGKGMSGLFASDLPENLKPLVDALMSASGKTLWVDAEETIDAVTAVSGSGPAYVFHMVEAMTAAGEELGLSPSDASLLARQTVIGAAHLLEARADSDAGKLREQVTSPGGTTAAALEQIMQSHETSDTSLTGLMIRAVKAANKRSKELAS